MRMKRVISFAAVLLMIPVLWGCSFGKEPSILDSVEIPEPEKQEQEQLPQPDPASVSPEVLSLRKGNLDQSVWIDGRKGFDITWQGIYADEERWSNLEGTLEDIRCKQASEAADAGIFLYDELCDIFAQEPDHPGYSSHHTAAIQRADQHILSIREEYYGHTGGVHPNTVLQGTNLDPETGKVLYISDVLTDTEPLRGMLAGKIEEKYPNAAFYEPVEEMLKGYSDNMLQWTMDYQSIRFYFSAYEMASYADGPQIVELWFHELGDLLPDKYRAVPTGGFSQEMPLNTPVTVDLDPLDGAVDEIVLQPVLADAYGSYGRMDITVNGQTLRGPDIYAYEYIPYLFCVPTEDSSIWYLYIHSQYEGLYPEIQVFSVSSRSAVWYGNVNALGFAGSWEQEFAESGAILRMCPLDPSCFWIGHPVFMFGTYDVGVACSLDLRTGMPAFDTREYQLIENYSRETLMPLEALILPDESAEWIPRDTELKFLRVCEDEYLVVGLPDGREAKLPVECTDWTCSINGYEEYDLFKEEFYEG